MSTILIRIRRLRELVGHTQDEVADQLGITQAAYSRLENGRTRLDFERLEQIAALYGFTQAELTTKQSTELVRLLTENPKFNDILGGGNGDIRQARPYAITFQRRAGACLFFSLCSPTLSH